MDTEKQSKPLTIKETKFVKSYLATGSTKKAAMAAYDCKDEHSAATVGRKVAGKLNIQEKVQHELENLCITPRFILERVKEIADNGSNEMSRLKACEILLEMMGWDKVNVRQETVLHFSIDESVIPANLKNK